MSGSSVEEVLVVAHNGDVMMRQKAALWLGANAPAEAGRAIVDLLVSEVDDAVIETLTWAAVAARSHSTKTIVEALERDDLDEVTTTRLLHALSKLEAPTTVEVVRRFANDQRPIVAAKAWWALARIGAPETLADITDHLGVSSPDQREALIRALVQWGPSAVEELSDDDSVVRSQAAEALIRIADPDARGVMPRRDHQVEAGVEQALEALRNAEAHEVDDVLLLLADDPHGGPLEVIVTDLMEARS